jgi:hypothetical protein
MSVLSSLVNEAVDLAEEMVGAKRSVAVAPIAGIAFTAAEFKLAAGLINAVPWDRLVSGLGNVQDDAVVVEQVLAELSAFGVADAGTAELVVKLIAWLVSLLPKPGTAAAAAYYAGLPVAIGGPHVK